MMKKINRVFTLLLVVCMMFLLQGCSKTPDEGLCKAVANVEEIHRLCMYSKVNPKDVPGLCAEAQDMAGKSKNDKVLVKAIDEACEYASWRLSATPTDKYKDEYKEIEGCEEIYDLASIRLGLKRTGKDGTLYRLVTGELADWERSEIENNKEQFMTNLIGYPILGLICLLILFGIITKIKHSFWFHR